MRSGASRLGVEHRLIRPEGAGVDAEERELADVGVDERLEHERRERRLGRGPAGRVGLRGGVGALHLAAVGRRGRRSTIASSTAWTPMFRSDEAGRTGKTLPAATASRSPFASCSSDERALLEELLQEILVGLRHRLHELLAPGLRRVLLRGGDVRRPGTCRWRRRRRPAPSRDQVHDALEGLLLARPAPPLGPRRARNAAWSPSSVRSKSALLPVQAVDHDDARQRVLVGELPDLLGLDLDARHRVHHDERGVRHPEGGAGLRTGSSRSPGCRSG